MIDFAPDDAQLTILDTLDRLLAAHLPADDLRRRDTRHIPVHNQLPERGEEVVQVAATQHLWALRRERSALSVPCHAAGASGERQRSGPTGGAA